MGQLELLWHLQNHDRKLNRLKLKLKQVEKGEKLDDLQIKMKGIEYDIANKKTQRDVNEVKIQRYSNKLEQLNFTLKEIEDKLYSGAIKDVRQLTYMSKEAQEIKKEMIKLEKDTISLMEDIEVLDKELKDITLIFQGIDKELNNEKNQSLVKIQKLEEYIKNENKTIEKILSKVENDLKQKYILLKQKKGKAIATVSDDKCTGCHMSIPLCTLDSLKNTEIITYCDNCGRILYLNRSVNEL